MLAPVGYNRAIRIETHGEKSASTPGKASFMPKNKL
jgi:hypothetical protein